MVLKTKHEALLSRIPLSPNIAAKSVSSPTPSPHSSPSPLRPLYSTGRSVSDASPSDHVLSRSYSYTPRYRRISAPPVDISFLADQNAELLSKLEKLESEATSADMAGRRELKRLEKEFSVLKDELEKTQAKSEELEEKAKAGFGLGAEKVIEEVWKRKKEREAKLAALRRGAALDGGRISGIRNFAPDAPSPFRTSTRHYPGSELSTLEEVSIFTEELMTTEEAPPPMNQDHHLVTKLLEKIQELESTNTRILEQQIETTSRLQAVQRETEFITKVYERLNEDGGQHEFGDVQAREQVSGGPTSNSFRSRRNLQSQILAANVKRQRSFHKRDPRRRGNVMNLFEDLPSNSPTPTQPNLPVPFNEPPWSQPRHQPSYSIGSNGLVSPALSTLSLSSPPLWSREISPSPDIPIGPNLANELGDRWASVRHSTSLRPRSFSDVSVLSVSPSPCPPTQPLSHTVARKHREDQSENPPTPQSVLTNSLQLSVEPPTPQKLASVTQHQESLLIGNMSPRFRVSRSLRSRDYLYNDGRYPESLEPNPTIGLIHRKRFAGGDSSPTPLRVRPGSQTLGKAFQVMMDEFDGRTAPTQGGADTSRSPSPDFERYADAKESLDEADDEQATAEFVEEGESCSESSLTTRSQNNEVTKSRFGALMVELWMWLQFIIIMLVFLWAMARKGPKSVLMDAERKRTLSVK